jgi:hypothetical protein
VEDSDSVTAETGQVHTVPAAFRVSRAMTLGSLTAAVAVQPGDTIWLLDYQGEGLFNAWVDGRRMMATLDFSTFGGSTNSRFGDLLGELKSIWWVRIRTDSGTTGWTDATDAFGGKDACAC